MSTPTFNPLDFKYTSENILEKTKDKGLCGIDNLGNTCYVNSIIQCLSHTDWLREYILLETYKETVNADKVQFILINELNKLLRGLWYENAVVTPKSFLHYLQILSVKCGSGQFVGNSQQDSNELLVFLLDLLHESVSRPNEHLITDDNEAGRTWFNMYKSSYSPIIENFYSQIENKVTCNTCNTISINYDSISILNIPISPPNERRETSIYYCFNQFNTIEDLLQDNQYKCSKCDCLTDAKREETLYRTGNILIISLKRFTKVGEMITQKNTQFVNCPIDNLDLSAITKHKTCPRKYSLYAVSNHSGSLNGGHYYSHIKKGASWYLCNDMYIQTLNKDDVISDKAYILFYKAI